MLKRIALLLIATLPGISWAAREVHPDEGKNYKAALVAAIKSADRIVVTEHSDRDDFRSEKINRPDLPKLEYGNVELGEAMKASFLKNAEAMDGANQTSFSECIPVFHHTIQFYSGRTLKSTMEICFQCGDINWDAMPWIVPPKGLWDAIKPLIKDVGFHEQRDWGAIAAAAGIPAFPSAEGAGKWTRGGRGGKVIAVTNLDDSGPGSLRAAIDAREPRTVIFRISGTIELTKPLRIAHPFITIAGQTAPGDGICLKNHELQIYSTHDVIVRHLRCRPGDKTSKPGDMDSISLSDVKNVIIDHCSATWSTDECLSVTNGSHRVTVQHCLIAEALTEHSYGSIIGAYDGAISYLHNLYASNRSRNPRPGGYQAVKGHENDPGPRIDFRHNVLFNWGHDCGYTGSGNAAERERIAMNYVGNYLKPGADTRAVDRTKAFTIHKGANAELFLDGNLFDPPHPVTFQSELLHIRPGSTLMLCDAPIPLEPLAENLAAKAVFTRVLEKAGAVKPKRDAVDAAIVAGVRDGSGRQKLTIAEDAWPALRSGEAEPDKDGDGIPDSWERKNGLNDSDPGDAARVSGAEGWTNLELWLNAL